MFRTGFRKNGLKSAKCLRRGEEYVDVFPHGTAIEKACTSQESQAVKEEGVEAKEGRTT